jgi:hypothetical protein
MSEQYFLQKCIVTAEDAKASFSNMSNLDLDQQTKEAYKGMMQDIGKNERIEKVQRGTIPDLIGCCI